MTAGFGTPISQSALTPSTNTYTINFSSAGSADAPDVYIGVKTTGTVTGTNYATADNFTCKVLALQWIPAGLCLWPHLV
jgi:hypothetical protein